MPLWPTGNAMEVYSLKGYSVSELEKLLETCPWFPIARKELFLKMSAMGEEYRRDMLRRTVLYLYPEYSVFREAYVISSAAVVNEAEQMPDQVYELDLHDGGMTGSAGFDSTEAAESGGEAKEDRTAAVAEMKKQIYVVGYDYFMPEELRNVQDRDISSLGISHDGQAAGDSSEFTDGAYYTETLARIYADQELYDRANEVYELIQNSKGGGLAANFAAGNQTFGVRQTADFLEKATWTLAIIILALCILATAFTPSRKQGDNAVLQRLEQTGTNTGAPEFPTTLPGGEAAPIEPVETPAE